MKGIRAGKLARFALTVPTGGKLPNGRPEEFIATYSRLGLVSLDFPGRNASRLSTEIPEEVAKWHAATEAAVAAVLNGQSPQQLPPLDLTLHSAFRQLVWDVMRGIPPGQTLSYGEIAWRLGKPGGARAVGNACGANPIPLIIPCHRVLAGDGKLGGFSGGLDWKRRLLAIEKVLFSE